VRHLLPFASVDNQGFNAHQSDHISIKEDLPSNMHAPHSFLVYTPSFDQIGPRAMMRVLAARVHEQMSVSILDDILADNLHDIHEDDLNEEEIKHIKNMITSEKGGSSPPPGKRWLYEVCRHAMPTCVENLKSFISPVVLCSACKLAQPACLPHVAAGEEQ